VPPAETVEIRYLRPPGRLSVFRQRLVTRSDDCIVTLMQRTPLRAPSYAGGHVILEPGAPVVWFTFPGAWHDIGRFHTAGGEFTGFYANLLSPVRFIGPLVWETTDLFLDVWFTPGSAPLLLDEDELDDALARAWLDAGTAATARAEAARLLTSAAAGAWPPPVTLHWTLERARAAIPPAG
jgi:predicted RNA-binding protein associated with RNAse of E/G family